MSAFENLTSRAAAVVNDAFGLALERDDAFVTPEHVLHVLINPKEKTDVSCCLGLIEMVNPGAFAYQWDAWERSGVIEPRRHDDTTPWTLSPEEHPRLARVLEFAFEEARYRTFLPGNKAGVEQLLVAITREGGAAGRFLNGHELYYDGLRASLYGDRSASVLSSEVAPV